MRTLADLFGHAQPWFADAACATSGNPEAWFPTAEADNHGEYLYAKSICKTCPVRVECLDYAITNGEKFGCWGGLAPRERTRLVQERAA